MNLFNPEKTVNLELAGLDGNSFFLMAMFSKQARKEGWEPEEIKLVLDECKSGDRDNLLCVLMDHCNEEDMEDEFGDFYEDIER